MGGVDGVDLVDGKTERKRHGQGHRVCESRMESDNRLFAGFLGLLELLRSSDGRAESWEV